ncbi:MAG: Mrp/NBP35 family ATP-binding protein [Pseudomonadota bacterium]
MTRDDVLERLRRITHPATGTDLVTSDVVRALTVEGGKVRFVLEVAPEHGPQMEPVRQAAVAAVEEVAGVGNVSALVTAHQAQKKPPDLKIGRHPKPQQGPQKVPGVNAILAVASGKGGVGKSTVSANLAVALVAEGKRVGLLDADVYGPSQPRMMGVSGRPASPDGKTIIPLKNHGVTMMSIGLMVKEDEAVVWRGPMLMGALQQMLGQVQWGELDVLLVDLPPGTGDVQLTLAQKSELTGAIVVSTPQDIALLDARKALNMFEKLGTTVFGMIENMSTYICPKCGHEAAIFGHGGAKAEAERLGLPFLGEIPLDLEIRTASDGGTPITVLKPESPQAEAFRRVAQQLVADGVV